MSIRYWLVVQPLDRARLLVEGGFVQVPWGRYEGVAEMREADGVALYSPRERNPEGEPLRAFVQAGRVAPGEAYQPGGRGASPWRRDIEWMRESRIAPIRPLRDMLEFTGGRYWGEQLRDGWLEISRRDFIVAQDAVRRRAPEPSGFAVRALRETGLRETGFGGSGGETPGEGGAGSGHDTGAGVRETGRADGPPGDPGISWSAEPPF